MNKKNQQLSGSPVENQVMESESKEVCQKIILELIEKTIQSFVQSTCVSDGLNLHNSSNETQSEETFKESNTKRKRKSDDLDHKVEVIPNNLIVREQDINTICPNTDDNVPDELLPILDKDKSYTFQQCLKEFKLERLMEIANYLGIFSSDNSKKMIKMLQQQFEGTMIEETIRCYLKYTRIMEFRFTKSLKTYLDPMKKEGLLEYATENGHELNMFDKFEKSKIKSKLIEMSIKNERSLSFATYMEMGDENIIKVISDNNESNLNNNGVDYYDPKNHDICKSDNALEENAISKGKLAGLSFKHLVYVKNKCTFFFRN